MSSRCYQHLIPVLCKLHTNIYNPGLYNTLPQAWLFQVVNYRAAGVF